MNIIVPKVIDLENEPFENVTLFYKPEIGEFDIGIRRGEGGIGSILKLELNEIDKYHIGGGLIFLAEKAKAYMENGIEGIEGMDIKGKADKIFDLAKHVLESKDLLPLNCFQCSVDLDEDPCSFQYGGTDCLRMINQNKEGE